MTITKPNGETTVTTVRIWNETVSNLTLMALGSSAPEILLSVIEVHTKKITVNVLFTNCLKFYILKTCIWALECHRNVGLVVVYVKLTNENTINEN